MKLKHRLVVLMATLLFITFQHTYSKQDIPVRHSKTVSQKIKDTVKSTDLFSPSDFILVKLP
jgi:hypothetical protein